MLGRPKPRVIVLAVAALLVVGGLAGMRWRAAPSQSPHHRAAPTGVASTVATSVVVETDDAARPVPPRTAESDYVSGWVVDVDGRRVSDARVVLDGAERTSTDSDEDGVFFFSQVQPGEHWLSAALGDRRAGPVAAVPDPTLGGVVLKLRRATSLEVNVFDLQTLQPIEGALVELRSGGVTSAITDLGGRATVDSLPSGRHVVSVSAEGYAATHAPFSIPDGAGQLKYVVRLERGVEISGHAEDDNHQPVAGAQVEYRDPTELGAQERAGPGTLTGPAGQFALRVPVNGDYRLTLRHRDFAPSASPLLHVGSAPVVGVVLRLSQGGKVAGRVVDKGGAPRAAVNVRVLAAGGGYGSAGTSEAFTDERGFFEMAGLPRARLNVRASTGTAASAVLGIDLTRTNALRGVELVLESEGRIRGVVRRRSGAPAPGATVFATPERASLERSALSVVSARAGGRGEFVLTGLAAEERYRLVAVDSEKPGASPQAGAPYVSAAVDDTVELTLEGDGGVRGTVRFDDGSSPKGLSVGVQAGLPAFFSNKDGTFSLERVPPGEVTVRVAGADFATKLLTNVRVDEDRVTELGVIVVNRGRSVAGRVTTPDGTPVAGAHVYAAPTLIGDGRTFGLAEKRSDFSVRSALTGTDGRFTVQGAGHDDKLVLLAEHPRLGKSQPTALSVTNGSVPVELVIEGSGRVSGVVTQLDSPVEGILVSLVRADSAGGQPLTASAVTSGADGAFAFGSVAAGKYDVFAVRRTGEDDIDTVRTEVSVVAGQEARVSLTLKSGSGTLRVGLLGVAEEAQTSFFTASLQASATLVREMSGGQPVEFDDVEPGKHQLCIYRLSSTGDSERVERGPPSCREVTVGPGPSVTELSLPAPR